MQFRRTLNQRNATQRVHQICKIIFRRSLSNASHAEIRIAAIKSFERGLSVESSLRSFRARESHGRIEGLELDNFFSLAIFIRNSFQRSVLCDEVRSSYTSFLTIIIVPGRLAARFPVTFPSYLSINLRLMIELGISR